MKKENMDQTLPQPLPLGRGAVKSKTIEDMKDKMDQTIEEMMEMATELPIEASKLISDFRFQLKKRRGDIPPKPPSIDI